MKQAKQIFGTQKVDGGCSVGLNIHRVKNVTTTYDREIFKADNKTVVYINIEYEDYQGNTQCSEIKLFCDNPQISDEVKQ